VSETANVKTWTCLVQLKDGRRLPDLDQWRRELREMSGELFTIHGVEATIEGVLVEVRGELTLKVSGSDVVLRLQELQQKVQLDPATREPQPPTASEKEACQRLAARLAKHSGPPPRVRIVGPLVHGSEQGHSPTMTVREFVWEGTPTSESGSGRSVPGTNKRKN
jgi:hypothetical protein